MTLSRRKGLNSSCFRQETGCVVSVGCEFPHHAARDEAKLRTGGQEDCFDVGNSGVGIGKVTLVFEILHLSKSSDYEPCAATPCKIDGQASICLHCHARIIGVKGFYIPNPGGDGVGRRFMDVVAYGYH